MTRTKDKVVVTTMRAFKNVIAQIDGGTEDSFLNIIEDARASLPRFIPFQEKIVMIKKDIFNMNFIRFKAFIKTMRDSLRRSNVCE